MGNQLGNRYTKEFKVSAAKMIVEEGMKAVQVCKDLGVSRSAIILWVKQYKSNGMESFPGSGKLLPQEKKIRDLEKQVKRLTMEREILKKAITFFLEHEG